LRSPEPARLALVAAAELPALRDLLAEEGWAVVELPPGGLDGETAAAWLDQAAEEAASLRADGGAVVLLHDGTYAETLAAAFSGLGTGPLAHLAVPAETDELRAFLRASARG